MISDIFQHKSKTPQALVELTCKQWPQISHNSITLDKISVNVKDKVKKYINYDSMNSDNGIKIVHEKCVSNKETSHWKQILVSRMKHNFLGIVTKKENILFQNENFFIFSTHNNEELNSKNCVKKKNLV